MIVPLIITKKKKSHFPWIGIGCWEMWWWFFFCAPFKLHCLCAEVIMPSKATMARLLRKNGVNVVHSSLQSSPWIQQGFLISAGSPSTPAPPSHCLHSVPWTFVHQSVGAKMPVPHLAPEVSFQRPLYPESSRDTSADTPKKYPHVSLLTVHSHARLWGMLQCSKIRFCHVLMKILSQQGVKS